MHVLTKLFVVLVSLLVVLLVPLVVVYAHNENSYQTQYRQADASAAAARSAFEAAKASHGASILRKDNQITQLEADNLDLRRQADRQEAEVRQLEARLAEAENMDDQIRTQLSTLSSAVDAGQQLTESLISELRSLRRDALTAERQKVELDEALRDASAQLDAAVEARRALQEELQRLKDEHASSLDQLGEYAARHGPLPAGALASEGVGGRPVDVDLNATIVSVVKSQDRKLAEIDAGSRDGVKEGWLLTIGEGGSFVARLRIISVDINRATGVVELEDPFRREVRVGQEAYARANR
ncbi:MAG: hypothetical protein HKO59_11425 [Phycisphaerales bacterium]|nr:hypothetical protein [Phycisphaerales bacterium]NNM26573.1 hypothetical protein [Phycisphaerales bacterium]